MIKEKEEKEEKEKEWKGEVGGGMYRNNQEMKRKKSPEVE